MAAKLTRLTHKIAIKTARNGRELAIPFAVLASGGQSVGYTLVYLRFTCTHFMYT